MSPSSSSSVSTAAISPTNSDSPVRTPIKVKSNQSFDIIKEIKIKDDVTTNKSLPISDKTFVKKNFKQGFSRSPSKTEENKKHMNSSNRYESKENNNNIKNSHEIVNAKKKIIKTENK